MPVLFLFIEQLKYMVVIVYGIVVNYGDQSVPLYCSLAMYGSLSCSYSCSVQYGDKCPAIVYCNLLHSSALMETSSVLVYCKCTVRKHVMSLFIVEQQSMKS